MSGFEPQTVFKPSQKFDNARRKKYANDEAEAEGAAAAAAAAPSASADPADMNIGPSELEAFTAATGIDKAASKITNWFENKKTEANKRVDAIIILLNTLQPGDTFSILKSPSCQYRDYDFFKWVVLYCEVKDTIIQLGRQCFVDSKDDIMQNRGIVKNNGYSSVFINCVNSLFPQFDVLLRTVLSKGYPGRDLYPSPLLMFEHIIENINATYPLFGDYMDDRDKLTKYGVLSSPIHQESIGSLILQEAHKISVIIRTQMYKDFNNPNSIVSCWVQHVFVPQFSLNQDTNKDMLKVANFVAAINASLEDNTTNKNDKLDVDIRSILKYALLIKLNSHYQTVSDWTAKTLITQKKERSQRTINTAWMFYQGEDDKINDLKRRLGAYDDYFYRIEEIRYGSAYGPKPDFNGGNGVGGSKTKRQRKQRHIKQRQRKQKSKRKKN